MIAISSSHARAIRRTDVEISRWHAVPQGVERQKLAHSKVTIRNGRAQVRLSSGDEHGVLSQVDLHFLNLDSATPRVQLVDLVTHTPTSPALAFTPGESTLRIQSTRNGFALRSSKKSLVDPRDIPPAGSWEVELGGIPPQVSSLWGQHLAIAPVDGKYSFLPPVH
jgi:hypothetical protein